MKTIGYIRKTFTDNNLTNQMKALSAYGCTDIICETPDDKEQPSAASDLVQVISKLTAGDILVINCLHHLGKSTRQLTELSSQLKEKGIHLVSLEEDIDTRHPMGEIYFKLLDGLAKMECALIKERTLVGLNNARKKGKIGGRPKIDGRTVKKIRRLYFENKKTIQFISTNCGVSVGTCYKYINLPEADVERLYP
jgi:DNA invertase Pin-like site-specific DNA recombinase